MSLLDLAGALFQRPSWWDDAACLGTDPTGEKFHPSRGEAIEPALAACAVCPVVVDCREYALVNVIRVGIWGGMSEKQRRRERHQRMRVTAGLERLPDRVVEEPAPPWVAPEYRTLWSRKRAPRRATFGAGSVESKRVARQLAKSGSVA